MAQSVDFDETGSTGDLAALASESEDAFAAACRQFKAAPDQFTDAERLQLYGLFKQANVGDCNTSRPGLLDPKGKAKWDAWDSNKGKAKDTAMEEYVCKVESLQE